MLLNQFQQAINRFPKESQLVIQTIVAYSGSKIQKPEAMEDIGILSKFEGIAIQDFWKSCYRYVRDRTHTHHRKRRKAQARKQSPETSWSALEARLTIF